MVNDKDKKKERYSFSKLSSFHICKYGYKQTYIDHKKGVGNCFSSYGILMHEILEQYAKGEIDLWNLVDIYKWRFATAVREPFPSSTFCKNMKELYYNQGLEYLKNFPGYADKKILEVEAAFDHDIDDWTFNGVIDLVFEDKEGRLVIQDYKSKSSFKNKKEQSEYARQLYLYSMYVKDKYGRYPDILRFVMFRKNTSIDVLFNKDSLNEAITWAKDTVNEIRECWSYPAVCEEFYGQNLCNHRNYCKYKKQ